MFPPATRRTCWICFAQDDEDDQEWVNPCRCRGTTKWTHQMCVQRWIDEKQGGVSSTEVRCPQCQEPYKIGFPSKGLIADGCDVIEKFLSKSCPFVAGGILVGSVYWIAVTYGAVTVMQVLGHKEGLSLMERADPLFLLIGLPTIPVMLVLSRLIRWQEMILKLWRTHRYKLPLGNRCVDDGAPRPMPSTDNLRADESLIDTVSITRLVNGGLVLPTIATLFGKLLFRRVESNIQRTFLGGIAFITLKGIMKIYCRQREYIKKLHRRVLPFEDSEQEK